MGPKDLTARTLGPSTQPWGCWWPRLLCPWDFPGENNGVGCHFQEIFLTDRSNPGFLCLLNWQADSLPLTPPRKPYIYIYTYLPYICISMHIYIPYICICIYIGIYVCIYAYVYISPICICIYYYYLTKAILWLWPRHFSVFADIRSFNPH